MFGLKGAWGFSFAMLLAKAKLSEFEEECEIFKRKYGDFEEFKRNDSVDSKAPQVH